MDFFKAPSKQKTVSPKPKARYASVRGLEIAVSRSLDYFPFFHHFNVMNHSALGEYRKTAEALFPSGGFSPEQNNPSAVAVATAAVNFAEALGIGGEYRRLREIRQNAGQMHEFLGHFQNNLDLLIQKTWVEKADESRKEKLQDQIPPFMALIEQGDFGQAIEEFGKILNELAYLFFGLQSTKEDFTEYAFRIDDQIGLFWWYGSQLGGLKDTGKLGAPNDESLWAVLLIGICYLTNF